MELRQLRYFVEVARLNSYSLASKTLFITQSTISQQIRKLEEELGVELLTRDTRHVVLSDYGEQFYPCALQVLEDARAGKDRIRDVVNLNVGTLSVGSTYAFSLLRNCWTVNWTWPLHTSLRWARTVLSHICCSRAVSALSGVRERSKG